MLELFQAFRNLYNSDPIQATGLGFSAIVAVSVAGYSVYSKLFREPQASSVSRPPDININAPDNAGTVTGYIGQQVITGYSIKEHEEKLKRAQSELRQDLEELHKEKTKNIYLELQLKEKELENISLRLANLEESYQEQIGFLENQLEELKGFKGQISDTLFVEAERAIKNGDTDKADQIFAEIAKAQSRNIKIAAKAFFERGKIADNDIKYYDAYQYFKRSIELNPDNPDYLLLAAESAFKIGKYDKALEWNKSALGIYIKNLGKDHPSVAKTWNNMGIAYRNKGDHDKALEFYNKSLNSGLKTLGKDHPFVAQTWMNMGSAYNAKGDHDKALEFYNKSLNSDLKNLGKDHPSVANTWMNMGITYDAKGDHNKALEFYNKSLNSHIKTLGKYHPSVAQTWNNMGIAYRNKGDHDKALEFYNKSLNSHIKTLGKDHPSVAKTWMNMGSAYYTKGDHDKAFEFYNKSLNSHIKTLGEQHPSVAKTWNNMGGTYYAKGDYNKAVYYLDKAYKLHVKILGKNHPNTKTIEKSLGDIRSRKEQ